MDKIKILQVVHSLEVGGTERLVCDIVKRLKQYIDFYIGCLDRIGILGEDLKMEGFPTFLFHRKPGYDFTVSYKMAKFVKRYGINIIHAHQYTPYFYSVFSKFFNPKVKLLFTEHGRHYPDINKLGRKICNRFFNLFTDKITSVSLFAKDCLIKNEWFPPTKIEVIYNGVDVEKYRKLRLKDKVREELRLKNGELVVGFVGRFHPIKNPIMLIRAFELVVKEISNVRLLMIGDGELLDECKRLVFIMGLEKKVLFLGMRADIADLLQICDVFALTSLSESTSVSIIEAMFSGLPVVATNVGGNSEIVRDGLTGRLCPSGDYETFAAYLIELLKNKDLRLKMGVHARRIAMEMFTMDKMLEGYLKIYKELIRKL